MFRSQTTNTAQISTCFPVVCRTVVIPLVSTEYTSLPRYKVVVGPAGTSVGKSMSPLCPVAVTVYEPSRLYVVRLTDPPVFKVIDVPFCIFTNVSTEPLPALIARIGLPFLSVNVLLTCTCPLISSRTSKPGHAIPAGKSITGTCACAADGLSTAANAKVVMQASCFSCLPVLCGFKYLSMIIPSWLFATYDMYCA
jgi:hypothetical protein